MAVAYRLIHRKRTQLTYKLIYAWLTNLLSYHMKANTHLGLTH